MPGHRISTGKVSTGRSGDVGEHRIIRRPWSGDWEASAGGWDDAALIERSWVEPEAFATVFDRHAR